MDELEPRVHSHAVPILYTQSLCPIHAHSSLQHSLIWKLGSVTLCKKISFYISLLITCAFAYMCVPWHTWGTEDNLEEMGLFFHHVNSGGPTQVIRCGGKCLYPLKHLASLCSKYPMPLLCLEYDSPYCGYHPPSRGAPSSSSKVGSYFAYFHAFLGRIIIFVLPHWSESTSDRDSSFSFPGPSSTA